MARRSPDNWLKRNEPWDLADWSREHLLEALAGKDLERSREAARELIRRADYRTGVPLVRWVMRQQQAECSLGLAIAGMVAALPGSEEKGEALRLLATVPDPGIQRIVLRSFLPK